jgi:hypothetical protein
MCINGRVAVGEGVSEAVKNERGWCALFSNSFFTVKRKFLSEYTSCNIHPLHRRGLYAEHDNTPKYKNLVTLRQI